MMTKEQALSTLALGTEAITATREEHLKMLEALATAAIAADAPVFAAELKGRLALLLTAVERMPALKVEVVP